MKNSYRVALSGLSTTENRMIETIFKVSSHRNRFYSKWSEDDDEAPDFYLLRQAHTPAREAWERWIRLFDNPQAPILLIGTEETIGCHFIADKVGRDVPYMTKPIVALKLLDAMDQACAMAERDSANAIRDDASVNDILGLDSSLDESDGSITTAHRGRALVVDDSDPVRAMMHSFLGKRNRMFADFSITGKQAFEKIESRSYDIIFLDVMLPDTNGFEICRRIKRDMKLEVPVVMMTSRGGKRDRMQGILAEADDYLVKPVDPKKLQGILDKHLSQV